MFMVIACVGPLVWGVVLFLTFPIMLGPDGDVTGWAPIICFLLVSSALPWSWFLCCVDGIDEPVRKKRKVPKPKPRIKPKPVIVQPSHASRQAQLEAELNALDEQIAVLTGPYWKTALQPAQKKYKRKIGIMPIAAHVALCVYLLLLSKNEMGDKEG